MRRRITWLVAATSSALVVAFVIPLCLLLVVIAEDRAAARARDQAQNVAALIGTVTDQRTLAQAVTTIGATGATVIVVTASGQHLGSAEPLAADSQAAVDRARTSLQAVTVHQDHGIDAVVPVARAGGVDVVLATVPEDEVRAGVVPGWLALGALGAVLVGAAVLMARELGRRVSTPVTELGTVAHRLYEGDLSARARPSGPEETAEVGRTLNRLADRINDLLVAERERVADLGHRLRTPVTALRLATDRLDDREAAERLDRLIDELHHQVDSVVRDARRGLREDLPLPVDVGEIVAERAAFWGVLAEDLGRELVASVPQVDGGLRVAITRADVIECIDTLIDNCLTHTPDGAPIALAAGADGSQAWFEVADGGPGLASEGYRGRGESAVGSTGLGLDIVDRIATSIGGQVGFTRSHLGGLSVRVSLPRAV